MHLVEVMNWHFRRGRGILLDGNDAFVSVLSFLMLAVATFGVLPLLGNQVNNTPQPTMPQMNSQHVAGVNYVHFLHRKSILLDMDNALV